MKLLVFYTTLLLLLSCFKANTDNAPKTGTIIFYTRNPAQDRRWSVAIDGVDEGPVPYTDVKPFCNQSNSIGGLYVTLPIGKHTAKFTSLDGYTPYSLNLYITEGCYPYR